MTTIHLTWAQVAARAHQVLGKLINRGEWVYPVPRGGIHAAQAVCGSYGGHRLHITEDPAQADLFIDDIVDSGATRSRYQLRYGKPFFALVDKTGDDTPGWYSFPWERMNREDSPRENVRRLLQYLGENPDREGLKETPERVLRGYQEMCSGYQVDPTSILKVFEEGACDEMVLLKGIEFSSLCEHHVLPFLGEAHIAYLPAKRIIGLSKLARLLEVYARRLQVQERLTTQITAALDEYLKPLGSACVIEARHLCMACRGVRKQSSVMVTSSLTGEFRKPEVRAEFFNLIRR